MGRAHAFDLGDNHKRAIGVTLAMLDQALCEIESWARGREAKSVLYRECNTLSEKQRRQIISEIGSMRDRLKEAAERLGLSPTTRTAVDAVREEFFKLWEPLVETQSKGLKGYGDLPEGIGAFLDGTMEEFIAGLSRIVAAAEGRDSRVAAAKTPRHPDRDRKDAK